MIMTVIQKPCVKTFLASLIEKSHLKIDEAERKKRDTTVQNEVNSLVMGLYLTG